MDDSGSSSSLMSGQIFIGRQPILDRHERVVAYELLYRDSAHSSSAVFDNQQMAATRIMANTFASMGVDAILGPYTGFVNVDRGTLMSELVSALPRERVVVEILEDIDADPEVIGVCKQLRNEGFHLALDDYVYRDPREELLDYVETVKVDLTLVDDQKLRQLQRKLRRKGLTTLAEKVETREQFESCRDMGFDLFQGFYFARPTVITGTRIDPARSTLLKLLNQIRADVETEELCETVKAHPNIGVNILRLVNSAAMTRATRISTVRDAVNFLGRKHLQRWFNLLLFAGEDKSGFNSPLLQTAAKRGRLMELLAHDSTQFDSSSAKEDSAFLVGMASMLDALLNLPLAEVVRELNLDQEIGDALLNHSGNLGALLQIAEQLDSGDFPTVSELVGEIGISAEQTVRAELEAFRWVQDLGHDGYDDD